MIIFLKITVKNVKLYTQKIKNKNHLKIYNVVNVCSE
jgi:hypothetical protein